MAYLIKTEPFVQNTIDKGTTTILYVRGAINDLDVTFRAKNIDITFYLEFLDSALNLLYSANIRKHQIVTKIYNNLINTGSTETVALADAKTQTDAMFKSLLAGTRLQRYNAMVTLCGHYNLALKPLIEQDGELID